VSIDVKCDRLVRSRLISRLISRPIFAAHFTRLFSFFLLVLLSQTPQLTARTGCSGVESLQFLVSRGCNRSGTAPASACCNVSSPHSQACTPKGALPPLLDTSSTLLLFSAAANIAGASNASAAPKQQASPSPHELAPLGHTSQLHVSFESLDESISRVSTLLQLRPSSTSNSAAIRDAGDSAAAASGLEAAAAIAFASLNDCEREGTIHGLTHSMVLVLIQAAGGAHGHLLLQRFALMALAGVSMSASGRRLLLNDATPPVPPLLDVLSGGELHAAALAALVLGNLALQPQALAAIDRSPAAFAREVVALMSSDQVRAVCACVHVQRLVSLHTRPPHLLCRLISFALLWVQCETWL
jgi:hypothetical protein